MQVMLLTPDRMSYIDDTDQANIIAALTHVEINHLSDVRKV